MDAVSDSVVVTVLPNATAQVRERLLALSPAVRLVEAATPQTQQGGDVVGGEAWRPATESQYSIGFSATGDAGSRTFVTAGHCTNDANQAAYGKDGTRLGTSNVGGSRSVNTIEGDFGVVDVTEPSWALSARVSGYGSGDASVTGSTEPTVGMSICRSGQATQWRCGAITQINQNVDYGNVVIGGLFITNACSNGGDSGGSYVAGPKDNAKAVGLHSGGGNPCGQSNPNTNAQPVNEALIKWNLTLVTSTPQPGAPTVADPGNRTTVVNTPVTLNNSATGGTAPYTWSATGLPPGLTIGSATGVISGKATTWGLYTSTLTLTDAAGTTASVRLGWSIWN